MKQQQNEIKRNIKKSKSSSLHDLIRFIETSDFMPICQELCIKWFKQQQYIWINLHLNFEFY